MRGNKITDSIRKFIMPVTRGWANYFSIAEAQNIFASLDGWIRRKIRGILWRQWGSQEHDARNYSVRA